MEDMTAVVAGRGAEGHGSGSEKSRWQEPLLEAGQGLWGAAGAQRWAWALGLLSRALCLQSSGVTPPGFENGLCQSQLCEFGQVTPFPHLGCASSP